MFGYLSSKKSREGFERYYDNNYIQEIISDSQVSYPHGGYMCTSSCVCMCLMLLGGEIETVVGSDSKNMMKDNYFSECIRKAMRTSSQVQSKSERKLSSLDGNFGGRMLGVWEIFSSLSINPMKMGFDTQELVIVDDIFESTTTTNSCLIKLEDLPSRMKKRDGKVGCVITCDGHSVCLMYDSGYFSFFDPMPSKLIVGILSPEKILRELSKSYSSSRKEHHICDATLFYRMK